MAGLVMSNDFKVNGVTTIDSMFTTTTDNNGFWNELKNLTFDNEEQILTLLLVLSNVSGSCTSLKKYTDEVKDKLENLLVVTDLPNNIEKALIQSGSDIRFMSNSSTKLKQAMNPKKVAFEL